MKEYRDWCTATLPAYLDESGAILLGYPSTAQDVAEV